jgi:hypothetical protein
MSELTFFSPVGLQEISDIILFDTYKNKQVHTLEYVLNVVKKNRKL